jgi:hypothetical protein
MGSLTPKCAGVCLYLHHVDGASAASLAPYWQESAWDVFSLRRTLDGPSKRVQSNFFMGWMQEAVFEMTFSAEWLRVNSKNENDPTRQGIHSNKRNEGHLFNTFKVNIF